MRVTVRTPKVFLSLVWPLPLSLATTRGISVDFFSSRYLDVSVPGVPRIDLWIQSMLHGSSPCVFPHSEICGSKLICSSPQLIAACRVLHRLLMPRHSPCALLSLTSSEQTSYPLPPPSAKLTPFRLFFLSNPNLRSDLYYRWFLLLISISSIR